jgi:hypothetical protein
MPDSSASLTQCDRQECLSYIALAGGKFSRYCDKKFRTSAKAYFTLRTAGFCARWLACRRTSRMGM